MNRKSQMITQSTIINMGWTKTMIKNLLPEPTEKPNPHYKCAAPMKLWEKEKVLEIMETEDFKQALEKAIKRKSTAKSVIKTKEKRLKEKMVDIANDFNIAVISDDELIRIVLEDNKNRIKVNLYKHMDYLVNYDSTLGKNIGKVGKDETYPVFKKAVLERIATLYPKYAAECQKQAETIGVTYYA